MCFTLVCAFILLFWSVCMCLSSCMFYCWDICLRVCTGFDLCLCFPLLFVALFFVLICVYVFIVLYVLLMRYLSTCVYLFWSVPVFSPLVCTFILLFWSVSMCLSSCMFYCCEIGLPVCTCFDLCLWGTAMEHGSLLNCSGVCDGINCCKSVIITT